MDIKNIIFDLGGVLLNLDMSKTAVAFRALIGDKQKHQAIYQQLAQQGIFRQYEVGAISTEAFVKALQEANPNPVTQAQIETAWSSMLLDLPAERLDFIEELRKQGYRIYLLSNINDIHLRDVRIIAKDSLGITDFDKLFDKAYYSHIIGQRKPDKAAFEYVVKDANLLPQESLFIDDNAPNLVGARALGIHTIHHEANSDVNKRLRDYLLLGGK